MKKKYINSLSAGLLMMFMLVITSSCTDEWDKHYKADPAIVSDVTLWEQINASPDLSEFAAVLRQAGYDKVLSSDQMYTVWAPVNGSFSTNGMDEETIAKELIGNHIARSSLTASGNINRPVLTINNKYIPFKGAVDNYSFSNASLKTPNILAKNGILHVLNSQAVFQDNIWEYLSRTSGLDSISKFLHQFDTIVFSPSMSIEGGANEDGSIIYLDSAFIETNLLFRRMGYLNAEDSTYSMLLPNNRAWNEAYDRIKTYFRYDNKVEGGADLQDLYAKIAITNDLVFNNNTQPALPDSILSTSYNMFSADDLLAGSNKVEVSNGSLYITDLLAHRPWESWAQTLRVEAESPYGREQAAANVFVRSAYGSIVTGISQERYLEVSPSNTTTNPSVTFSISNTLATSYNIYCVFVPAKAENKTGSATTVTSKPSKVRFRLSYNNEKGEVVDENFNNETKYPDSEKLDTILVAANYPLPACSYALEEPFVKLRVLSNVSRTETVDYTRTMRLDCIIFEPAR